jgi:hypothetical protein
MMMIFLDGGRLELYRVEATGDYRGVCWKINIQKLLGGWRGKQC